MTLAEAKAIYVENYPEIPWEFVMHFFVYTYQRTPTDADAGIILSPLSTFTRLLEEANTHRADFGYYRGGQAPPPVTPSQVWNDESKWRATVNKLIALKLIPALDYEFKNSTLVSKGSRAYYNIMELLYGSGLTVKGFGDSQDFTVDANFMSDVSTYNSTGTGSNSAATLPAAEKTSSTWLWVVLGAVLVVGVVVWVVKR